MTTAFQAAILNGIPNEIPDYPPVDPNVELAKPQRLVLGPEDQVQAVLNALRYFPEEWHAVLAPEFASELLQDGRITMHRFRPHYEMRARSISEYPGACVAGQALQLMFMNNLDPRVAQYPYSLTTYGGNARVFQNWAQYLLVMQALAQLGADETLVLYSGRPHGIFKTSRRAPRIVLTNGLIVPRYATEEELLRLTALGVTNYGQMTCGSGRYIGPQGIVHGTTLTLRGAARLSLGLAPEANLSGKLFVSSGLGGMSGAQAKAAVICGAVGIIAEVKEKPLCKRHAQGWLMEWSADLDQVIKRALEAQAKGSALSIGYHGNVVQLWEELVRRQIKVDLGSDQTSLHDAFGGGYIPVDMTPEQADALRLSDPKAYREAVFSSLRRQMAAIQTARENGTYFWDYGNALLLRAQDADADVSGIPSYVKDIMGPLNFDYGFGPFRWVCTSGDPADLQMTDSIAAKMLRQRLKTAPDCIHTQLQDNLCWIEQAEEHALVVGSQARILYTDLEGRIELARAFNRAVAKGQLKGPIVISRDDHDVGGTDSPARETANISDGSNHCAEMAIHNFVGDAMRGATLVSLHHGGGTGWGNAINGGFSHVLDGTRLAGELVRKMLEWDVGNGLTRRAWAGNSGAIWATEQVRATHDGFHPCLPVLGDPALVRVALAQVK